MDATSRWAAALAAGALLLASSLSQVLADTALPGDWNTGIATNYGGAQDGMVRDRSSSTPCSYLLTNDEVFCTFQGRQFLSLRLLIEVVPESSRGCSSDLQLHLALPAKS